MTDEELDALGDMPVSKKDSSLSPIYKKHDTPSSTLLSTLDRNLSPIIEETTYDLEDDFNISEELDAVRSSGL